MDIKIFYTRLNNWFNNPDIHPFKKFWVLSVSLHILLFVMIIIDKLRCTSCDHLQHVYLIPAVLICPFTGILFYFLCFINEAHDILDYPLSIYVCFPILGIPLLVCYPLVLYARQNIYIKYFVYIVPVLLSLLGTLAWMIESSRGGG